MSEIQELLCEFESTTDQLIQLAQELLDHSSDDIQKGKIEKLQEKQKDLVDKVLDFEKKLSKKGIVDDKRREYPNWLRIEEKLAYFQTLNEQFINNFKVRKGLIQFEVEKVQKTKRQLQDVKKTYGGKGKKGKGKDKKDGRRINTLS